MFTRCVSAAGIVACAIVLTLASAKSALADNLLVIQSPTSATLATCLSTINLNANNVKGTYSEIQTAVAAAEAANKSDIIYVCPGTYVVPVNITGPQQQQIIGAGLAILQPTSAQTAVNRATGGPIYPMLWIHDLGGNTQIINLTVDGTNFPPCTAPCQVVGVLVQNAQSQLQSNTVQFVNTSGGGGDGIAMLFQTGSTSINGHNQQTQVQLQGNNVHDYLSSGYVANEVNTQAQFTNNVARGLGEASTVPQSGFQIGFGASGVMQNNLSTNHTGPAPHCTGSSSSTNYVVVNIPDPNIQLQQNVSSAAEIGVGVMNDQVQVQNNLIADSLCIGVYVNGNQVHVNNNNIYRTCNPAQGACSDPVNSPATAIYVVGGSQTDVSGNFINQATYGVASAASSTNANNEALANVGVPFAGTFANFQALPVPHDPSPVVRR